MIFGEILPGLFFFFLTHIQVVIFLTKKKSYYNMPFDNLFFAVIIGVKFHVSEYIKTSYILKVALCVTLIDVFHSGHQDTRITEN